MTRSANAIPIILMIYLVLAALYAVRTPAWQAPDEPAHYNYVAQVAVGGCCPVIESGDWDSAYLDALKGSAFAAEGLAELPSVQYEDHQPPLYYLILAPFYTLTGGSLTALRLVSALFGAMVVLNVYIAGFIAFPKRPQVAALAALLVATLPQFVAITASVNNDSLSWALIGLAIVGMLAYLRDPVRDWRFEVALGVICGLALLTKANALMLLPLGVAAILIRWRWIATPADGRAEASPYDNLAELRARQARAGQEGTRHTVSVQDVVRRLAAFAGTALVIAALWWVRNISVYGFPDVLGLAAHDRVVVGQLRTAELIAQVDVGEYARQALTTTFQSFFGQLGWMALPLPTWVYVVIAVVLAAALAGWVMAWRRRELPAPYARETAWLLALAALLALAQYVYYNTSFVQFQGRYLFAGLIPFALFVAGGLDVIVSRIMRVGDGRAEARPYEATTGTRHAVSVQDWRDTTRRLGAFLLIGLLIPLNLWLVWRVLPSLAP
jgi:hypothetical protein